MQYAPSSKRRKAWIFAHAQCTFLKFSRESLLLSAAMQQPTSSARVSGSRQHPTSSLTPAYSRGMPRVYKKKGSKNKWTDTHLHEALGKIRAGELSLRATAVTYKIPKGTLSDHVRGTSSKHYGGGPTVLTVDEEREIVITCQVLAEMGFPLTKVYKPL